MAERNRVHLERGRELSLIQKNIRRAERQERVLNANKYLFSLLSEDVAARKIALAMLYLGEGSKTERGSLMFGNSSPVIIRLFLKLLRDCFDINEQKLHVTVQCRADQDVRQLQAYWMEVTGVSSKNFYKPQIDSRTMGKPTKKSDYKGVCRIDYFSSDVDFELKLLGEHIEKTLKN